MRFPTFDTVHDYYDRWRGDGTVSPRRKLHPSFLTQDEADDLLGEVASTTMENMVYSGYCGDAQYSDRMDKIRRGEVQKTATYPIGNRMPREKSFLVSPLGSGLTRFEEVLRRLGNRVKETKSYYMLDGRPCNATDIMALARSLP